MAASSFAESVGPLTRSPGTSIELAQALLGLFTSGEYEPGDRLPGERQLADDLGVGRSTVREALKSLAVLGIIEVRQGDGTYLRDTTSDLLPQMVEWGVILGHRSLTSLAEARHHVEVTLATLAATRRTEPELALVQQAYLAMETAAATDDLRAYVEADLRFHLAIATSAHSDVLMGILRSISGLLREWTEKVVKTHVTLQDSLRVHEPILRALEAGDAEAGRAAMDHHMVEAVRNLHKVAQ